MGRLPGTTPFIAELAGGGGPCAVQMQSGSRPWSRAVAARKLKENGGEGDEAAGSEGERRAQWHWVSWVSLPGGSAGVGVEGAGTASSGARSSRALAYDLPRIGARPVTQPPTTHSWAPSTLTSEAAAVDALSLVDM